jgi:hypothetical protein
VSARRVENEPEPSREPETVVWKVETQPSRPSWGEEERLVHEALKVPLARTGTVAAVWT